MRNYAALIMVALVLALTVPAQALTNGSFESGLTGWGSQINGGGIGTTTQHHAVGSGDGRVYNPTDGNRFALLRAGDAGRWVRIAQQFNVARAGFPGDDDQVVALWEVWFLRSVGLPEQSLEPVAGDGVPVLLVHAEPQAIEGQTVGTGVHHQPTVGHGLALREDEGEVALALEPFLPGE